MTRRRRSNDDTIGTLLEELIELAYMLPWWADLIVATTSYIILAYLSHTYPMSAATGAGIILGFIIIIAKYTIPLIFTLGAIGSAVLSFKNRNRNSLTDVQVRSAAEFLSRMSWQEFEIWIGDYFMSQGYEVTRAGGAHADGGVDIELHKDGELYLVQCKHYRAWKVPVETVRDLYGVMTSRGASGGFVVTSGRFTTPAKEFASGRVITLIDGEGLSEMLKSKELT